MTQTYPDGILQYTKLSATNTTLSGAAGKVIRIWQLLVAPSASTTLELKDGGTGGTSLTGSMTVTGLYQQRTIVPHYQGTAGNDVAIMIGANGAGYVIWTLENP